MIVADPLLHPYLEAPDDESAERELAYLLEDVVFPQVRDVLRGRLRSASDRAELDDVQQDVLLQLTGRLRLLRARRGSDGPIEQLRGYVSVVARRACDGHIRRRFPERTRLRSRVRYVLMHHPECLLDSQPSGQWCGLRARTGTGVSGDGAGRLRVLAASVDRVPGLAGVDLAGEPLAAWLPSALAWIGAPVELDDLVSVVAVLTGTAESEVASPDADVEHAGWNAIAAVEPSHGERVEARSYLRWLWTEICDLPVRQRAALLLNLRDDSGGSVLPLLVLAGVAALAAVAEALELSTSELRALWPRLPVDDATIASQLGLTRQQVINLRKSARLRLARRSRRADLEQDARSGDEAVRPTAIRGAGRTSSRVEP